MSLKLGDCRNALRFGTVVAKEHFEDGDAVLKNSERSMK
jgi:hypothetical protein